MSEIILKLKTEEQISKEYFMENSDRGILLSNVKDNNQLLTFLVDLENKPIEYSSLVRLMVANPTLFLGNKIGYQIELKGERIMEVVTIEEISRED